MVETEMMGLRPKLVEDLQETIMVMDLVMDKPETKKNLGGTETCLFMVSAMKHLENKLSHQEACAQSFRIKVRSADYEVVRNPETWPYRVHVRVYRHFKQRRETETTSGQDGANRGGH